MNTCAGVPWRTISPSLSTTTRSHIAAKSSMLCDTMTIVVPCLCSWAMSSRNSRRATGSRPATGSSSTSASGVMASTPAKATRRCWPPESSKGLMSRRLSMERPTRESDSRTRVSTSSPERPRLRGPNATSSNTVVANSWRSGYWNTMPMRAFAAAAAFLSAKSSPPTSTRPRLG